MDSMKWDSPNIIYEEAMEKGKVVSPKAMLLLIIPLVLIIIK